MDAKRIVEDMQLTPEEVRNWTKRSTFIKQENELHHWSGNFVAKAPRLIQGAQPEFINLVGPWIMALQDHFKAQLGGRDENLLFTSGLSGEKIGAWFTNRDGRVFENDISKFDSSICREMMELEAWIFRLFKPPQAVRQLILGNIDARGATHFGLEYFIPGTRKSGDPYTSLGNSLLNILMHLFIISEETGLSAVEAKANVRMGVQGDDNLLLHNIAEFIDWKRCFLRLGFSADCIQRNNIYDADFCSSHFVPNEAGALVMIPKLGRVLSKLGCFRNLPKFVEPFQALRGTVISMWKSFSFIPAIRHFFSDILVLTSGVKAWLPKKYDHVFLNHAELGPTAVEYVSKRYFGPISYFGGLRWSASMLRAMACDSSADVPFFRI